MLAFGARVGTILGVHRAQAICDECWVEWSLARWGKVWTPWRMRIALVEPCCFCREPSGSGIYIRREPGTPEIVRAGPTLRRRARTRGAPAQLRLPLRESQLELELDLGRHTRQAP